MLTTKGYFMTDEAEKAAKWEMVESYRSAKERIAVLREQSVKLGSSLNQLSKYLQEPGTFRAVVQGETIIVFHTNSQSDSSILRVPLRVMDPDAVKLLLDDIEQTEAEKDRQAQNLKDAGLDIAKL